MLNGYLIRKLPLLIRRSAALLIGAIMLASASAQARGCFDDWFCFAVQPTSSGFEVSVKRIVPYPVVLTLYSSHLSNTDEISVSLMSDQNHILGKVDSESDFWRSMRVKWTGGVLNAVHDDSVGYQFPLKPRERYRIVQGFNGGYSHQGRSRYTVDIAAPEGTPVYAARDGLVIDTESRNHRGGADPSYAAYANYVILLHADGTTGEYFHLKHNGVAVDRGDRVKTGQLIGYSGSTGFSSLPHLHFGVYQAKTHGSYASVPFRFAE